MEYSSTGSRSPVSSNTVKISIKDFLRPKDLLIQKMQDNMRDELLSKQYIREEIGEVVEYLIKETEKSNK